MDDKLVPVDIHRNVAWFYRARVKEPRDTVHAIAREYAEATGRNTDPRSVVQNGIRQAEVLLGARAGLR
jgi:hypothetical protein